jgi:hypothetical protein
MLWARPEAPAEQIPADRGDLAHAVLWAFLTPIKGMAAGVPKPEGLVSEAALKEIFTWEVRRLWRTEFRSLGRVRVYRDRCRKIWEAMKGWLRRQDGFKDVEILRLEREIGPPPKGAPARRP